MATRLAQVTPILVRNYLAQVNTFLTGKPALGKTDTIQSFVDKMKEKDPGFKAWMFYAPTMSPMDIQASAPNYDNGTLQLFNNEALPNAYTTPDAKGVIFFGELPNADQTTIKLLQKYVNGEDMSGVLRKPAGVIVIADGNRLEDKSSAQQQGRAFLSRFEQIEVYSEPQDNIDFAAKREWHPSIQLFFKEHPECIDNYDEVFETSANARARANGKTGGNDQMTEEGKRGIWANMRSWERVNRKEHIADKLGVSLTVEELQANLGTGVGVAYKAHKDVIGKLASYDQIMSNPTGIAIPDAPDEQYALMMIVALRCTADQLDNVHAFGSRLPLDMQAAMLKTILARKTVNLVGTPAYTKWISTPALTQLLNGR